MILLGTHPVVCAGFDRRPCAQRDGPGGEGLHARRATSLPQADGSRRPHHSGLPEGKSRQAVARVPRRVGQPRAIANGRQRRLVKPRSKIRGFRRLTELDVRRSLFLSKPPERPEVEPHLIPTLRRSPNPGPFTTSPRPRA